MPVAISRRTRWKAFSACSKRSIDGTDHHVSKKHLHSYVNEFAFRYNARKVDDDSRSNLAIVGFEGKRYRD